MRHLSVFYQFYIVFVILGLHYFMCDTITHDLAAFILTLRRKDRFVICNKLEYEIFPSVQYILDFLCVLSDVEVGNN